MNKTIRSDEDLLFAVEHLRTTFPAMKLEEWAIIMHNLKTGIYPVNYERLKLPELVLIFQQYEGERAARREATWDELKKRTPDRLSDEEVQAMYKQYAIKQREKEEAAAKETEVKRVKTDDRGRWEHIPYQSPTEDKVQQERGSQET